MFYRVDYVFAVMMAGAIAGALYSRYTSQIQAARLATAFYCLVAARVVAGAIVFLCLVVFQQQHIWNSISGGLSDFGNFIFGAVFGLALFRPRRLDVLHEPPVYVAICLMVGFAFLTGGFAKPALSMSGMTDFFTQSGYPVSFLKFIMTAEVLGGAAILIPWAVIPVTFGFAVDMFGAVWTHIHNGDPLNDSTGAIFMLVRLVAILGLWALGRQSGLSHNQLRKRLIGVYVGLALCAFAAVIGSTVIRHHLAVHSATLSHGLPTVSDADARRGDIVADLNQALAKS